MIVHGKSGPIHLGRRTKHSRSSHGGQPMSRTEHDTKWRHFGPTTEVNTPPEPSNSIYQKRDLASKDYSLHTHAEWSGRTDQPNDLGESDDNAPTLWTKAGILGWSIAEGSKCPRHFGQEKNRPTIGSVNSDAKPMVSSLGEKMLPIGVYGAV